MEQQSDAYYIGQVLSGNTGALKHLIEKYQHMAYTLAFRVVYNAEEAEEICQDAFLKAYRSLGTLRNPSHFSSWLYSIVYHLSISAVRKRRVHFTSIDQESTIRIAELTDEEEGFSDHIDTEQLDRAMQKLDETDRVIVTLYYLENYDVKALCQVTGLSASNIKIRLFRARKKLFDLLSCHVYEK